MINNVKTVSVVMALFVGVAVCVFGFWQLQTEGMLAATGKDVLKTFYPVIVTAIFLEAVSRALKIHRIWAGVAAAIFITLITSSLWPVLVCVWLLAASYIVGRQVLTVLRSGKSQLSAAEVILIGVGIYGTITGLAAHFPVNYPGVYVLALSAPILISRRWISEFRDVKEFFRDRSSGFRLLDLGIASVSLKYFVVALMPEIGHDALAMHLFISHYISYHHEWTFDVSRYVWAVMPALGDWLYAVGYMLAGETSARVINFAFILLTASLLWKSVIWAGGNGKGARWAVLLFLSTPLAYAECSSLFIESVWTAFVVAATLALLKSLAQNGDVKSQLPVAGVMLGFALATKAVTFTLIPMLALILIIRWNIVWTAGAIRSVFLAMVCVLSLGGIPYVTAWIVADNPVFPFYNNIFQSAFWPAVAFQAPPMFEKGTGWDVFYRMAFDSGKFLEAKPGASGFHWILLFCQSVLVLLWARYWRGLMFFLICILAIVTTFYSSAYLRYVFPSFALTTVGMGVAITAVHNEFYRIRNLFFAVSWLAVFLNYYFLGSATYYGRVSASVLMSSKGRDIYINKTVPIRNAVEFMNQLNTFRSPVAVFSASLTAGIDSDVLYANWYNFRFQSEVQNAQDVDAMAKVLANNGAKYVILEDSWDRFGKRSLIELATSKIAEFRGVQVRQLKKGYQFLTELLVNNAFDGKEGWYNSKGNPFVPGNELQVSINNPVWQPVRVDSGMQYKNSIVALCADKNAQGRLQVNWLDEDSEFIDTDIEVFTCTDEPVTYSSEVIAPRKAVKALIYVTGHTDKRIVVKKVSFKR